MGRDYACAAPKVKSYGGAHPDAAVTYHGKAPPRVGLALDRGKGTGQL
ncbi:hypothetical protein C357_01540 [Citreicella sp. 357]|nr:hypothetical protein C357_01540 [Citreicella sp. 357]